MFVLGLLLLGATGAFAGLLIAENLNGGPDYTVTLFGNDLTTVNGLTIFISGIALALIFCLGTVLATGGGILRRRRSKELRAYRAERTRSAKAGAPAHDSGPAADTRTSAAPSTGDTAAARRRAGRPARQRRLHFGR
ncbi:hypothetical protein [Kitasatospora sp. NBC_00315]|uniref:hypothetical protein n=1 Tax=Kitasatospora sp. NBC_00315 TaxID=2975963 RepID=UPI0032556721